MKRLLFLALVAVAAQASIKNIQYFEANFTQNIVDDENKTITYKGHIKAAKPQYALWQYKSPVNKQVYILPHKIVIVEPELEQAIIKKIGDNFDFFSLIKNAKKIDNKHYLANFRGKNYLITINNGILISISYKDELDNKITINFTNTKIDKKIEEKSFIPQIPEDYDLIKE